jgi:MFS family permease
MTDSSLSPSLLQRPFLFFLGGRLLSTLAGQIKTVAIGWQVYALSRDPLDLGLVGLVQFATAIALGLGAGAILDRVDRRRIWTLCQVLKFGCYLWLLVMTINGWASLNHILIAVAGIGAAQGMELPTTQALLALVVDRQVLPKAIAVQSSTVELAVIAGPALGGILVAIDQSLAYGAVTAAMIVTTIMGTQLRVKIAQVMNIGADSALTRILGGLAFLRARPAIWGAVTLDMVAVLLGGITSLLPVFATDVLHVGADGLGLLRTAMSIGAFAAAAWLARYPITRRGGPIMLASVAAFGLATLCFSFSTSFWLSAALMLMLGITDEISVFTRSTLVQLSVPDDVRGRVAAVNSIFITTSNQLGEFESGLTAAWWGIVPAAAIGGIGTILVAGLWAYLFPELRRVDDLTKGV